MIRPSGATKASSMCVRDSKRSRGAGSPPTRSGSARRRPDLSGQRKRGEPHGPPLVQNFCCRVGLLPDAALAAAVAADLDARTGREARRGRLRDREGVVRLRLRRDDIAVRAGSGAVRDDADLARARRRVDGQASVAELAGRVALVVVTLNVRCARLDLRDGVTRVGLGLRVLALLLLTEEGRQGDRGENADDEDHYEELDEREALLLAVDPLGKLPQHWYSSLRSLWSCQSPRQPPLGGSSAGSSGVSLPLSGAPELCVPALRRVCLCTAALTLIGDIYRPRPQAT